MIVFLLLIIIAILLFGSAFVLRGIGIVARLIAWFFACAIGISIAGQISSWVWWTNCGFVAGGSVFLFALGRRQQARANEQQVQYEREIELLRASGEKVAQTNVQAVRTEWASHRSSFKQLIASSSFQKTVMRRPSPLWFRTVCIAETAATYPKCHMLTVLSPPSLS